MRIEGAADGLIAAGGSRNPGAGGVGEPSHGRRGDAAARGHGGGAEG